MGVALRGIVPGSRLWFEGGITLAIHGVGAGDQISFGPGLVLGAGFDLYRNTSGALALSFQVSPMFLLLGDHEYYPVLMPLTLGIG